MTNPSVLDTANRAAIRLHPAADWLPFEWNGPLLRLPDGRLLGLGHTEARLRLI